MRGGFTAGKANLAPPVFFRYGFPSRNPALNSYFRRIFVLPDRAVGAAEVAGIAQIPSEFDHDLPAVKKEILPSPVSDTLIKIIFAFGSSTGILYFLHQQVHN